MAVPSRVSLLISILRLNLVLTCGILPEIHGGVHLFIKTPYAAIGSVPSLSGHAIAYQWRSFGITGVWKTMALKAEVWVEAVTEGGRRFMAAWREEEEDAARHRQEKREATRLGKLQSHTEA